MPTTPSVLPRSSVPTGSPIGPRRENAARASSARRASMRMSMSASSAVECALLPAGARARERVGGRAVGTALERRGDRPRAGCARLVPGPGAPAPESQRAGPRIAATAPSLGRPGAVVPGTPRRRAASTSMLAYPAAGCAMSRSPRAASMAAPLTTPVVGMSTCEVRAAAGAAVGGGAPPLPPRHRPARHGCGPAAPEGDGHPHPAPTRLCVRALLLQGARRVYQPQLGPRRQQLLEPGGQGGGGAPVSGARPGRLRRVCAGGDRGGERARPCCSGNAAGRARARTSCGKGACGGGRSGGVDQRPRGRTHRARARHRPRRRRPSATCRVLFQARCGHTCLPCAHQPS
jgi:hypothetical protein